jgi:uncharacterized lipoprotein YddW (UPF0748 family)
MAALLRFAALILALALAGCGPGPLLSPEEDAGGGGGGSAGGAGGAGGGGAATDGGSDGGQGFRKIVSLTLTPSALTLKPGAVSGATAVATFNDGSSADISGTVDWTTTPTGVVSVTVTSAQDNLVRLEALAAGTASVTARTGSIISNALKVTVATPAADAGVPNREVRAVWVTRFHYNTANDVKRIIADAATGGFNVVYFQIRGNGDAYYASMLAPWAKKLTGTLGKDPGWDPLQTAIDAAHLKGIELHAYWNVFAAWPTPAGCGSTTCTCKPAQGMTDSCSLPEAVPAGMPEHMLRVHPEWMAVTQQGVSVDSEYYWFSPGNPAVKQHIVAAATELLDKYAVDGLHLDRVRYPGQVYSYDSASQTAYNALGADGGTKPTYADWERANVTEVVAQIYAAMKSRRPNAVLSASVWGIYKPLPGCNTSQGYGNYYQDSIGWMKAGAIDALTPMIYWDIASGCTDWAKLLDGFMAGSNGRPIVAGMHALDNGVPQPAKMKARIEYARGVGAAGTSIFASTYLDWKPSGADAGSTWTTFRADGGPYVEDAGTPPITWR